MKVSMQCVNHFKAKLGNGGSTGTFTEIINAVLIYLLTLYFLAEFVCTFAR